MSLSLADTPPKRRPGAPLQHASTRALRLLLPLALDSGTAEAVLNALRGEHCCRCLQASAVVGQLVQCTRDGGPAAVDLDSMLADILQPYARCDISCSVAELAQAWARSRETGTAHGLAALLWIAARNNHPASRPPDVRLTEELEILGARQLARAGRNLPQPAGPCARNAAWRELGHPGLALKAPGDTLVR